MNIHSAAWQLTPSGSADTGGHLHLTLDDFHKIGMLVAKNGVWKHKMLVSKRWISNMTRSHTNIYERPEQYGYLWWIYTHKLQNSQIDIIYAHGNGGNFSFIVKQLDLVVTFTGKAFGSKAQFIPFRFLIDEIIVHYAWDKIGNIN